MNIHGTGCGLLDCIYADEDFSGHAYQKAMSKKTGDGGLTPGQLVFSDALEKFMGKPYDDVLTSLTNNKAPDARNLGGPSAVSLAHAAQILAGKKSNSFAVRYFGACGNDNTAYTIKEKLAALPFADASMVQKNCPGSRVDVFSDPRYDNGCGERTFVYRRGAQDEFRPEDLGDDFFNADIIAFGGTALVPHLHDNLTELLKRSGNCGAITEVNLVFDFRSEANNPGQKWKLGVKDDAYPFIDILIADQEEALKTSGKDSAENAALWFLDSGCGAVVITRGSKPVVLCAGSTGRLFKKTGLIYLPVCEEIDKTLANNPEKRGDTTGCGDNFAGQVIAELALAIASGEKDGSDNQDSPACLDLREICIPAVVAGGYACFIVGGTYYEKETGEKRQILEPFIKAYREQLRFN